MPRFAFQAMPLRDCGTWLQARSCCVCGATAVQLDTEPGETGELIFPHQFPLVGENHHGVPTGPTMKNQGEGRTRLFPTMLLLWVGESDSSGSWAPISKTKYHCHGIANWWLLCCVHWAGATGYRTGLWQGNELS